MDGVANPGVPVAAIYIGAADVCVTAGYRCPVCPPVMGCEVSDRIVSDNGSVIERVVAARRRVHRQRDDASRSAVEVRLRGSSRGSWRRRVDPAMIRSSHVEKWEHESSMRVPCFWLRSFPLAIAATASIGAVPTTARAALVPSVFQSSRPVSGVVATNTTTEPTMRSDSGARRGDSTQCPRRGTPARSHGRRPRAPQSRRRGLGRGVGGRREAPAWIRFGQAAIRSFTDSAAGVRRCVRPDARDPRYRAAARTPPAWGWTRPASSPSGTRAPSRRCAGDRSGSRRARAAPSSRCRPARTELRSAPRRFSPGTRAASRKPERSGRPRHECASFVWAASGAIPGPSTARAAGLTGAFAEPVRPGPHAAPRWTGSGTSAPRSRTATVRRNARCPAKE